MTLGCRIQKFTRRRSTHLHEPSVELAQCCSQLLHTRHPRTASRRGQAIQLVLQTGQQTEALGLIPPLSEVLICVKQGLHAIGHQQIEKTGINLEGRPRFITEDRGHGLIAQRRQALEKRGEFGNTLHPLQITDR